MYTDTCYTSVDPEGEALLLSRIVVVPVAGSKKRRREEKRCTEPCFEYARSGTCKFGDSCRFGHDVVKALPADMGKVAMRELAAKRAADYSSGAAAASSSAAETSHAAGVAAADAELPPPPPPPPLVASGAGEEPQAAAASAADSADDAKVALAGLGALVGPSVTPLSMIARFYTRFFSLGFDANRFSEDHYVHLQANRIALVGIAPAHPLVRLNLTVKSVVFNASLVGAPEVSGKHKRGAAWVEADTVVATATTDDGREWPLRVGVRSNLLELNSRLEAEPWLLTAKSATSGFLAVVNMHLKRVIEVTSGLLNEQDYAELCTMRGLPGPRHGQ